MLQNLDKQANICPSIWIIKCYYQKSSTEIYKLTNVPSIFEEKPVAWNLNKQMQPVLV